MTERREKKLKKVGKVFENLLEVNDRKSKGAFYTPREIVHYIRFSAYNHAVGA